MTSAGLAQAAPAGQPQHGLAGVHVINLHAAYERALGHARPGPIAGVTWARGHVPSAPPGASGAVPATCTEPNCPLAYNGGPVEHHPRVYLLFWGPTWQTDAGEQASAAYMIKFYKGLGVEPQDTWSAIMSQYTDGTGFPAFTGSVFVAAYNDTSTPPTGANDFQLYAEASAFETAHGLTSALADDQLVIATQSGTCDQGFDDTSCPLSDQGSDCAYHDVAVNGLTFTDLPYQPDAGSQCGQGAFPGDPNAANEGFSIVGGHEFGETVTDPWSGTGWRDNSDFSGGENADKCQWVYPGTTTSDLALVTLSTGTFAVQPLYSNSAHNAGGQSCPVAATPDKVTLTKPASQTSLLGSTASLQLTAASSTGAKLSYYAPVLPPGLALSSSTGKITGRVTLAGSYPVRIFADDATGGYASVSFTWTVKPLTGHITGYQSLCAGAYDAGTANGTRVVLSTCTSSSGQRWTRTSWNVGPLSSGGKCLTDPKSGGSGTGQVIGTCSATSKAQQWTHLRNGEWVLKLNALCLTDPRSAVNNGTQLILAACADTASQRWTLP